MTLTKARTGAGVIFAILILLVIVFVGYRNWTSAGDSDARVSSAPHGGSVNIVTAATSYPRTGIRTPGHECHYAWDEEGRPFFTQVRTYNDPTWFDYDEYVEYMQAHGLPVEYAFIRFRSGIGEPMNLLFEKWRKDPYYGC